jgi:D-alanyl-D-alanine carboxypeptidase
LDANAEARLPMRYQTFACFLVATVIALVPPRTADAQGRAASLVMDAATGEVLHAHNADTQLFPASLTKMMTVYLAFEAVRERRMTWETRLPVSAYAASMSPTKLGLAPGERVRLEDLVLGLITKSANDAAVVVAEGLGTTEAGFARAMTAKARRLGMSRTVFQNASGLPDPAQVSTARDMAILGRALIRDFPGYYPMFATRGYSFDGRWHGNHNALLSTYAGADGIKTGFIRASGYNLVASAERDGRRIIGVVFGGASSGARNAQMAQLLDRGFQNAPAPQVAARTPEPASPRIVRTALSQPPARPAPAPTTAPAAPPRVAAAEPPPVPPKPSLNRGTWFIQVGAFQREPAARTAAQAAQRQAPTGHIQITEVRAGQAHLYRARVAGLTEGEARAACRSLERERVACSAAVLR